MSRFSGVALKISMNSLDIMLCARELKNAVGARVDNVYELDGIFIIRLRLPEIGRRNLLLEPGRRIHLTERKHEFPKRPSGYAMLLRKHLANAQLTAVEQPNLERIVELKFSGRENRTLILELFGNGNLVLCDDQREIIQPYRIEVWRHRSLKPGERYVYPPKKGADVEKLDTRGLRRALEGAPDVVRALAINLNLGGLLAEEICARASVEKSRGPGELSEEELVKILKSTNELFSQEPAARVVYDDSKPVDVLPFDFKTHFGKRIKLFNSFNEALDDYFSAIAVTSTAKKQQKLFEEELSRLDKRLAEQEKHFVELYVKSSEARRKADLISIHHAQIDDILKRLMKLARAKGWRAVTEAVDQAKDAKEPWAKLIKNIEADAAKIELELADQSIFLDLRLSAFENASRLYEQYKRLAEKAAGAEDALKLTRRERDELLSIGVSEPIIPIVGKRRKPEWFERYRWFVSSEGLLVIAGRDVKTNTEVVEKHMEAGDRYLHADIVGAPHVVVKSAGKEMTEVTLREAAEFAAMHSRAWREGLGELEIYWVMPGQVSKRAPSGTHLPKGSYMIEGERNFLKVLIEAAVGAVTVDGEQVVTCGPPSAIEKHSRIVIKVIPGETKKSDLASKIQARLRAAGIEASLDELERALPPGKGEIKQA